MSQQVCQPPKPEKLSKDYRGRNLAWFDFSARDLRGADFSGAYLKNANFKFADIRECNFNGAILEGALFDHCLADEATKRSKTYVVEVQVKSTYHVRVKALTKEEAEEKAWHCWDDVHPYDSDVWDAQVLNELEDTE